MASACRGQVAAFYVRIQAMNVEEFGIPVEYEIDEKEDYEYIVACIRHIR